MLKAVKIITSDKPETVLAGSLRNGSPGECLLKSGYQGRCECSPIREVAAALGGRENTRNWKA
jgi:hypothetical protein